MVLGARLHSSCTGSFRRPSAPANPYRASEKKGQEGGCLNHFTKIVQPSSPTSIIKTSLLLVLMEQFPAKPPLWELVDRCGCVWTFGVTESWDISDSRKPLGWQSMGFSINSFAGVFILQVCKVTPNIGKTPSTHKFISVRFRTHHTRTTYSLHSRSVLASLKAGGSFERGFCFRITTLWIYVSFFYLDIL